MYRAGLETHDHVGTACLDTLDHMGACTDHIVRDWSTAVRTNANMATSYRPNTTTVETGPDYSVGNCQNDP